jgi:endonuclease/exonuclease/phosphatase family metal-dependent hydrolase
LRPRAGGPDHAQDPRASGEGSASPPRFTLQVLTYNIHKGFSTGNTRFVLHQIREALEGADVDLICLQEIQGEHAYRQWLIKDWPDTPQVEFLANRRWPHRAYGKNASYEAGHHGNAILSKFPFVFWENINVSGHRLASRSLLHGVIEPPGVLGPIHVICIHFGLMPAERRRQVSVLIQRIRSHCPDAAPLIIAGDFNDWSRQAEDRMRFDLGLMDVFVAMNTRPARTFPIWYPVFPVDRIFFRGVQPIACRCLSELPWRRLSDHAPLFASFALPAGPACADQVASGATAREHAGAKPELA